MKMGACDGLRWNVSRIELIGISGDELADWQRAILRRCYAVVVSKRYKHLVQGIDTELLPIAPVQAMLARVENALAHGDVAVL
ncbi:MAG: hypothetical protein GQ559_02975, partial [Desulfobulbaceae bacterium]|nr:hypothetical protein [Desulfobulbaceae bacterium]